MTDLAVGDVTVTIIRSWISGRMKYVRAQVVFGDASLTYPTGGVPLAKARFGFKRNIDSLQVIESNSTGYLFDYDISAETLGMYNPTDETGTPGDRVAAEVAGGSGAPAAQTIQVLAIGW